MQPEMLSFGVPHPRNACKSVVSFGVYLLRTCHPGWIREGMRFVLMLLLLLRLSGTAAGYITNIPGDPRTGIDVG